MVRVFCVAVITAFIFLASFESYGQCADCTVTVIGDNTPVEIVDGSVVCLLGTRTTPLDLLGRTGLKLCLDNSAVFSGGYQNMANPITITNHGQIGTTALPLNITLGAGSTFINHGEYFGNFVSNGGAKLDNSGTITGAVTLNATGAIYNNSGLQTGNLSIGDGNTVNNSNTFNISTLTLPAGGTLYNAVEATITVTNNSTINGNLINEGFISFTNTITLEVGRTLINKGNFNALNFTNNGTVSSEEGTISIGQSLTNSASGIINISSGSIGGNLNNSGNVNIFGSISVIGTLTNNAGANISAGSESQPSYLSVKGFIIGRGCYIGQNQTLHVNKFPETTPLCSNGEVYFGGNPSCPQIIDVEEHTDGGYQYFRKVYIFNCDYTAENDLGEWIIPGQPDDEEELLLDDAQVMIIGGGGGGGMGISAGGGGAGEVNIISKSLTPGNTVRIKIGHGGIGSEGTNLQSSNGEKSSFGSDEALGGGGGGSNTNDAANRNGKSGGSGGGGAYHVTAGQPGEIGPGAGDEQNSGAIGGTQTNRGVVMTFGGGGGGANGPGEEGRPSGQGQGVSFGGHGGPGFPDSFANSGNIYAGGGGGTAHVGQGNSQGGRGLGAGGDGNTRGVGFNGITAGSGGGAGRDGGGSGAKGIVMVTQFFRILPVNFINFSSEYLIEKRSTKLFWSTSKEWENSHFDIERSLDGTKTFAKIREVAGMGWTDDISEYVYEDDKLPLSGGNVYYRLKQVDFNGRYDYSDIAVVRVPNVHFTKGVWRAYPNPTEGNGFNIELVDISKYQDEPITLRILSSNISSDEMVFHTLQELNKTAAFFMANAPNGLWIVELQWGNKVERIKVMKQ